MSEQVPGLKGLDVAEDKWTSHFNDTRKKAKAEIVVRILRGNCEEIAVIPLFMFQSMFKKPENCNNELYQLVYKDTEAKLYRITEEAPLKPPRKDNLMAEYEEKKAAYIARWKPIVDDAYEAARQKVGLKRTCYRTVSPPFPCHFSGPEEARAEVRRKRLAGLYCFFCFIFVSVSVQFPFTFVET